MNTSLSPLHAHLSSTCLSQAQVLLAGNVKFRFLVVIQACFQGCKILPNDNNQSLGGAGVKRRWHSEQRLEVPLLSSMGHGSMPRQDPCRQQEPVALMEVGTKRP